MFVRFNTSKRTKNPVVQIVESYREGTKVKQRIIASLGTAKSDADLDGMQKVAASLMKKIEEERQRQRDLEGLFPDVLNEEDDDDLRAPAAVDAASLVVNAKNLCHESTEFDGFNLVISRLLSTTGFSQVLDNLHGRQQFDIGLVMKVLVAQMFDEPASKLRSFERQGDHGFSGLKLHL